MRNSAQRGVSMIMIREEDGGDCRDEKRARTNALRSAGHFLGSPLHTAMDNNDKGRIPNLQELVDEDRRQIVAQQREYKEQGQQENNKQRRRQRGTKKLTMDALMETPNNRGKTPQERLLATVEKKHIQEDEEIDLLAEAQKTDNQAKQEAQDKLADKLVARQDKLDADRDSGRAKLGERIDHKRQKREEELQAVIEAMRLLPAPAAPHPPPAGTPASLQAMTPASRSSPAARGGSPTRHLISRGHKEMSPIEEDKIKSTATELQSRLEVLSPGLGGDDVGSTLSLYMASVSEIRQGKAPSSFWWTTNLRACKQWCKSAIVRYS
jgi:hypothetical protein